MQGYDFISQPSLLSSGGVGFYISNNTNYSIREDLSKVTNDFEALWIEMQSDHLQHNIICGVVYRHPNSNIDNFIDYISVTSDIINQSNKYCAIVGDFNIDLLNADTHTITDNFLNNLGSCFFSPHILQPTRITDHSATLIDNIFFNSLAHHTISGNLICDLSDHLPNFLIINKLSALPKKIKIYRRDWAKFDKEKFVDEINQIDWSDSNCNDINTQFHSFYSKLNSLVDKYLPLKSLSKKSLKNNSKPWITVGIRQSIKCKNKLYKKFIRTKHSYYHEKFKYYRNLLKKLIAKSKSNYYNSYFKNNQSNIKNIWKGIKSIIALKPFKSSVPSKIIVDNSELTDSKSIADAFNNHFINVSRKLTSTIPSSNRSPLSFMQTKIIDSFTTSPLSPTEIEDEIARLNPSKSVGSYSIPIPILKLIKHVIAEPLSCIFNYSLQHGIVPEQFKIASVTPVFKSGSRLCMDNFRPISLLSIFNRILEKVIYNQLITFINNQDILYEKQFGFRTQHSAEMTILLITDKIQRAIDDGMFASGIFLDLSKAFDTVNHEILLLKLEFYGIRGVALNWFRSYLTNRKQSVNIGDVKSGLLQIGCGVPQGSILGPLLFLLYINDFPNSSNKLDFHIFADDSNLFYNNKSLEVLERTLNSELTSIHSWLCANKLSLNIKKSHLVIFHPPQKVLPHNINITVNGKKIEMASNTKYLGVLIDSHLNWKCHVSNLAKKVKRNIGVLSKLSHFASSQLLNNLYYSLIYPFFLYGITTWGNTYSSTIRPLFILQKKTIRIITKSKYDDHTDPLFKTMNILKLEDLVFYCNAIFMYDFHNNNLPKTFEFFFKKVSESHSHNTRLASKSSFVLPKARTNYGKFNIRFKGAEVWNSIKEEYKTLKKRAFKICLRKNLLCSYCPQYPCHTL